VRQGVPRRSRGAAKKNTSKAQSKSIVWQQRVGSLEDVDSGRWKADVGEAVTKFTPDGAGTMWQVQRGGLG
jgi:hypothetical protein